MTLSIIYFSTYRFVRDFVVIKIMLKSTVRTYYYRSFLYGDIISSRLCSAFKLNSVIHKIQTWTTGSLTYVCALFACICTRGTSYPFAPLRPTTTTLFIAVSNHFEINLLNALSLRFHIPLLGFLNPYIPRDLLKLKPLMKKAFPPFRKLWPPPETNGEKHSTTSSLNKRSPSSELHVSRTPK